MLISLYSCGTSNNSVNNNSDLVISSGSIEETGVKKIESINLDDSVGENREFPSVPNPSEENIKNDLTDSQL